MRYWWLDSNEEVSPFRGSANADYKMSGADQRAVSVMCHTVYTSYRSRQILLKFSFVILKDREIARFAFERVIFFYWGLLWLVAQWIPMELVQDGEEWMVFSDSMKMGRLDGLDGLDVKCTVIEWCITPNHTPYASLCFKPRFDLKWRIQMNLLISSRIIS